MSDNGKEEDMVEVEDRAKDLEDQLSKLKHQLSFVQSELTTAHHKQTQLELKYKESIQARDDLLKENERLSSELQKLTSATAERVDTEIQTDEVWLGMETDYSASYHGDYYQTWNQHAASSSYADYTEGNISEPKKVGDLGEDGMPVWDTTQNSTEEQAAGGLSIAEGLKAAATEVLQESGVVYDEASGMYYDAASGYYVNPDRSLYYEPHSGTYYVYDHEKQEYKFHSQVDVNQHHNQGSHDTNNAQTKTNMKANLSKERRRQRKQKIKRFVQHISDRKERRRVAKAMTKRLKREEKLAALEGKTDKASTKKRRKVLKASHGADKSKRKSRYDSDEEYKTVKKKRAKRKPVSTEGKAANGDDANCDKPKSTHKKNEKAKTKKIQEASVDIFAVDSDAEKKVAKEKEQNVELPDSPVDPPTENIGENLEGDCSMDESESELEDGEVSSEEESMEVEEEGEDEKETEEEPQSDQEEESAPIHYAPCIRAMVIQSDCLDEATLFIITCTGGTMGRDPTLKHVIAIPDINISKAHTEVTYREDLKKYTIQDLASQNGTFLNNHRLSEPKVMSHAYPLSHRDVLTLGGTTLMLHIHPGTETCDECEPGQARAVLQALQEKDKCTAEASILTKAEKEQLRRQQLKMIKKKFGLENMSYMENKDAINNPAYQDKAEERRQTKGSDNPYQPDDAPASVDRPITETNKGHQLLAKMGWTKGQGLGREEQGRAEPVQASVRSVRGAGLGTDAGAVSLNNVQMTAAAARRAKTRMRFQQIQKAKPDVDSQPTRGDEIKTAGPVAPPTWVKGEVLDPS